LNQPIVGMAAVAGGYWLVASDGGIFSFGAARFEGSAGAIRLARPIVGMAAGPGGYWLVASDGGIFNFGVPFLGSAVGSIGAPAVGMAAPAAGKAYAVVAANGQAVVFQPGQSTPVSAGAPPNPPLVGAAAAG
ncbi:MAG TPA: hypothetical protein VGI06_14725, partial [Acidimicrobiales bacterium]